MAVSLLRTRMLERRPPISMKSTLQMLKSYGICAARRPRKFPNASATTELPVRIEYSAGGPVPRPGPTKLQGGNRKGW